MNYHEHVTSFNNKDEERNAISLDRYVTDQRVLWEAKQLENRMFDLMMAGPNGKVPGYAYAARSIAKTFRKEFLRQYIDNQKILQRQLLQKQAQTQPKAHTFLPQKPHTFLPQHSGSRR